MIELKDSIYDFVVEFPIYLLLFICFLLASKFDVVKSLIYLVFTIFLIFVCSKLYRKWLDYWESKKPHSKKEVITSGDGNGGLRADKEDV